jgi:hypothetical protein
MNFDEENMEEIMENFGEENNEDFLHDLRILYLNIFYHLTLIDEGFHST